MLQALEAAVEVIDAVDGGIALGHQPGNHQRHRGTQPSRELPAYAGDYEHPAYGIVQIRIEEGQLRWRWHRFAAGLEHYHYDTFVLPIAVMGRPLARFTLGDDGNVAALHVGGNLDVTFRRTDGSKRP